MRKLCVSVNKTIINRHLPHILYYVYKALEDCHIPASRFAEEPQILSNFEL